MERKAKRMVTTAAGASSGLRKFVSIFKVAFFVVFIIAILINFSLIFFGTKKTLVSTGEIGALYIKELSDIPNSELLNFILTNGTGDVSVTGRGVDIEIIRPFIERLRLAEETEKEREKLLKKIVKINTGFSSRNCESSSGNQYADSLKMNDVIESRDKKAANDDGFLTIIVRHMLSNAIVKPPPEMTSESSIDDHDNIVSELKMKTKAMTSKIDDVKTKEKEKVDEEEPHKTIAVTEKTARVIHVTRSAKYSHRNVNDKLKTIGDKNSLYGNFDNVEEVPYEEEEKVMKPDYVKRKKDKSLKINQGENDKGAEIVKEKKVAPETETVIRMNDQKPLPSRDKPQTKKVETKKNGDATQKVAAKSDVVSVKTESKTQSKMAAKMKKSEVKVEGRVNSKADSNRGNPRFGVVENKKEFGDLKTQPVVSGVGKTAKRIPFCNETYQTLLVGRMAVQEDVYDLPKLQNLIGYIEMGGHFRPTSCLPKERTAIIIPYRDRETHLALLLLNLYPVLKRQGIDFTVFVIEENLPTPFNRAMLFNIGFLEASKLSSFDCFIFHDVDLIPLDDRNLYQCHVKAPIHFLAGVNKFKYGLAYTELFGGVVAFTKSQYQTINGASNLYFGWGGEDDDLRKRCIEKGYTILRKSREVGLYDMVNHTLDKTNNKNPVRKALLKKSIQRQGVEGLSTTHYHVTSIDKFSLYTRIAVSIDFTQVLKTAPEYLSKEIQTLKETFTAAPLPKTP